VVRAVSTVRSLPAYEHGAEGPGKDCGYENVYLKAITGLPMSMEGKTAACAHLSPVGNVASAACDLWSNESVQAFKLLGGMAPLVSFEQLVYDCRLMNRALETGVEEVLKNLFVISDAGIDPQALVLSPESAIRIARSVVESSGRYEAAVNAARTGIEIIEEAYREKKLKLDARELPYLALMTETLNGLPGDESAFIEKVLPGIEKNVFIPSEYGL
jgi:methanol--5-hydroxybenzimidazolylcobamide Co-methyltransferase